MLTLTDAAAVHLTELLTTAEAPEDVAVRFVRNEKGLAMQMDNERPGDDTFAHEGRTVLLLDSEVSEALTGRILDVEDSVEGPRLALG